MDRDNYYLLLDLSLSPPENDSGWIDTAIRKKQAEWSQMRNHPTKGRKAQLYLGMLADIKKVMADDTLRSEEAKDAKRISAAAEKEKYKQLDEAIGILSSKGSISEEEIANLAKRYKGISTTEIKKRVKVPITRPQPAPRDRAKPLDPTTTKKIVNALEVVKKASLYDFLEVSHVSSLNCLNNTTQQKINELRSQSVKDAVNTASGELTGHCINIFKTDAKRKAYDVTLQNKRLEQLGKAIETVGAANKAISKEYFNQLIKTAVSQGISQVEADEYIRDYCLRKKKGALEDPEPPSIADMQPCGTCGVINPVKAKVCESCGMPLEISCPKCGKTSKSTAKACSQCGFFLGDMPNAVRLIRNAQLALANQDFDQAANFFRNAELYWPGHPEISDGKRTIATHKDSIAKTVSSLLAAVKAKRFFKAHRTLAQLRQVAPNHTELSQERMIERQIQAAEAWFRKGSQMTSADDRLDAFTKAIAECKDYQDAINGLARTPPPPPTSLKAKADIRAVTLNWPSSKARGELKYRVIRKSGGRPNNPDDGTLLTETSQTFVDDQSATPGQSIYYAVYTVRGQILSRTGAVAGPVMRTAEPTGINALGGDKCINLTWKAPEQSAEVLVWLKPNSVPRKNENARSVRDVRMDGATIQALKNDQTYGLRISAVFIGPQGERLVSPGVTLQATPTKPPDPINDLKIKRQGKTLTLTWKPLREGSAVLIRSPRPIPMMAGAIIAPNEITTLGEQIPVTGNGQTQWRSAIQGILYVVPVTVKGSLAIVGKGCSVTAIDDVSNLSAEINNNCIYVEWQWPTGAQQGLVTYGHDTYPLSNNDRNATKIKVSKNGYERESAFIIKKPAQKEYYFTIFIQGGPEGQPVFSSGKRCYAINSEIHDLFYEIKISRSLFSKPKSAQLVMRAKAMNQLPSLQLVKKSGQLPTCATDGTTILNIQANSASTPQIPGAAIFDISINDFGSKAYAKLFFKHPQDAIRYRLMAPNKRKLQLF